MSLEKKLEVSNYSARPSFPCPPSLHGAGGACARAVLRNTSSSSHTFFSFHLLPATHANSRTQTSGRGRAGESFGLKKSAVSYFHVSPNAQDASVRQPEPAAFQHVTMRNSFSPPFKWLFRCEFFNASSSRRTHARVHSFGRERRRRRRRIPQCHSDNARRYK